MSSTPDSPQAMPTVPLLPTEGVNEVGPSDGIDAQIANPEVHESAGTPESVPSQMEESRENDDERKDWKPIPKGNFIAKYRDYADVVELPADAHEAVAMSLIAAILNRNGVYIDHGAVPIPIDFWLILISESGAGRNTLVGLAQPILKKAGLEDLIRKSQWGSEVALYQNFAENPSGLFIWPELSIILKKFEQPTFGGAKAWVTDQYDNYSVPDAITYRKTGKRDTPPIEFAQAPRINILGTSSEDWLMTNLVQEDTTGGFLPRFVLLKLDGIERDVPIPRKTDPRLQNELADQLRYIDTIRGIAYLSKEARVRYVRWYRETKKRFLAQPNPALARPFFNRLRNQVLKLALIHEIAETQSLEISLASLERAIATLTKIEETIFALLPTGMNREGAELLKMEQRIKEGRVDGVSQTVLTRAFQSTPKSERTQRIQTLCQGGAVVAFRRETGGRFATIYVHADCAEEHSAKFPGDQRP